MVKKTVDQEETGMSLERRPFDKQRCYVTDVIEPLKESLRDRSVSMDPLGTVRYGACSYPIQMYRPSDNREGKGLPRVLVTAGVHGNEPAGVLAAIELLTLTGDLAGKCAIDVVPCMNPSGYEAGTRNNADGLDVNRGFTRFVEVQESLVLMDSVIATTAYDLTIDLHETLPHEIAKDFSIEDNPLEFYLYETAKDDALRVGEYVVDQVSAAYEHGRCTMPTIYDDENTNGVIRYPQEDGNEEYAANTSLDAWLFSNGAPVALTLETPTWLPLRVRRGMHIRAIVSAVDAMCAKRSNRTQRPSL